MSTNTAHSKYEINSGDILRNLWMHWKRYDRDFLKELEMPIRRNLIKNNIITTPYNEKQEAYFKDYRDSLYPQEKKEALDERNFPIPGYFLRKQKGDTYPSLVEYDSDCIIPKEDNSFHTFFALKLSLTDEME